MSRDADYFHAVTMHLIDAPAAVRDDARLLAAGGEPLSARGGRGPRVVAASWTRHVLRPAFWPDDSAFLYFDAARYGVCDAVRAEFARDGLLFEVGQSLHIASIVMRPEAEAEPGAAGAVAPNPPGGASAAEQ